MDPREVKLSTSDEVKVMFSFLYHSFPWRWLIVIFGSGTISSMITNSWCGCGPIVNGIVAFIIGSISGLAICLILFQLIPTIYSALKEHYGPRYEEHRLKAQKRAVENVDNQLLK